MLFVCSESATWSSQKSMFIVIKRAPLCSLVITLLLSLFLRKKQNILFYADSASLEKNFTTIFYRWSEQKIFVSLPTLLFSHTYPLPPAPDPTLIKKIQSALFKWQRCIQKTGKHGAHHRPEDCCIFMSLLHVTFHFLGFFSWTV